MAISIISEEINGVMLCCTRMKAEKTNAHISASITNREEAKIERAKPHTSDFVGRSDIGNILPAVSDVYPFNVVVGPAFTHSQV